MKKENLKKASTSTSAELKILRQRVKELEALELRHKATEEALLDTNTFLRNILDSSSSISIISTDLNRNILYWNVGAERMFGYKAKEVVGKQKIDMLYPEDGTKKTVDHVREEMLEKKKSMRCEVKEVTKDGRSLWIDMSLTPRFDDHGQVVGFLGVGEDITERKKTREQLQQSLGKLRQSLEGVIHAMTVTIERRDPYTAGHQRRVAGLACAIAKEMGLPEEKIVGINMAGVIHDLGKISVPAEILANPGPLNKIQFDMIKLHPQVGYDIIKDIEFPWPVAEILLQHHEKADGSGYPTGLSGKSILPEAKILAVADIVEAIASHRPYRPALGIDCALAEIERRRDVCYDAKVVDACTRLFKKKGYKLG